jgi:predicted nucleotidyltransferase
MDRSVSHLETVGRVVKALTDAGFEPILVGGMALVILGSQRVTRDFDFVIAHPRERLKAVVDVLYSHGLELVSRFNDVGEVTATIANRRVAASRIRLDRPASVHFCNPETHLRIDLLFDFPVPAATLAEHATRMKVRSQSMRIASVADLLHLKKIARARRAEPGDAQDIAFLEARAPSDPR